MIPDLKLSILGVVCLFFVIFFAYHELTVYDYENKIKDLQEQVTNLNAEIDKQNSAVKELKLASDVKQKKIIHYQQLSQQRMKLASANALSVLKVQVPKGCEDASKWAAIEADRMGFE